MNSQEIEQENYIKVIVQLRKEMRKYKKPDSQLSGSNNSSLSLYNINNQQQLEDLQQLSDLQQQNQIQQPNSNITNLQKTSYIDMLEQAERYLKLVYKTAYNLQPENLDKRLQEYEMIPCKIIKQISSPQISKAISFNFDNSLLATAQGKNIKIENFNNGNIDQMTNFQAHESDVNSLVFSKITNYLFSGGEDCYIHMWEEIKQKNQWQIKISTNTKSPISCMILNKKENFIIVGNKYGFIQTWNINIKDETIKISNEIRRVHGENIFGVSLNLSENRLITCSLDKKIILWSLDQKGLMQIIAEKERINFVSCVIFLDDNKILLAQNKKGLIELKLENDKFQQDEKIIIEDQSEDCSNFQIQSNKTKNIIIIKHNRFIYMIRELNKGVYEVQKRLDYDSIKIIGALSSDSKYLVTINDQLLYLYELFE